VGNALCVHKPTGFADRRGDSGGLRNGMSGFSFWGDADDAAGSVEDGEAAVWILGHAHGGADPAMALWWKLEATAVPRGAIVAPTGRSS
jgi:hypothetical protein